MLSIIQELVDVRLDIVIGISLSIIYIVYYLVEVVKRPVVVGGGSLGSVVRAEVRAARHRFWPAPWCVEARLQTAAAALLRAKLLPPGRWKRRLVRLRDGGTVSLEWGGGVPGRGARRVLLLLPGLAGGAAADYARLAAAAAARLRAHLAVLSYRGLHGLPLTSGRLYSALSHGDVGAVVELLRREHPRAHILGCGVSLGGLLLGGHLARSGGAAGLACALLLAVPLDAPRGAASAERGALNAALSRHMARRLRAAVARHEGRVAGVSAAQWARVRAARSVRALDAALTAPALGLASPDHYYAAASLRARLHRVAVPTLAVCAADDPFQPLHVLPVREAVRSRHVSLLVCARGGHVGLVDARGSFLPQLLVDFFAAMLRRAGPRAAPGPGRPGAPGPGRPGARYLSAAEVRADAALRAAAPRDYDDDDEYDPYHDRAYDPDHDHAYDPDHDHAYDPYHDHDHT